MAKGEVLPMRLTREEHALLYREAHRRRVTMADLIRYAVNDMTGAGVFVVSKKGQKKLDTQQERRRRKAKALGRMQDTLSAEELDRQTNE